MKPLLDQFWKMALITGIGLAGSAVAGLMRYGSDILIPSGVAFAFIAFETPSVTNPSARPWRS